MEIAKLTLQCINGRQIIKKPSTEIAINVLNNRVTSNAPLIHSHLMDGVSKDTVFIDKKAVTNPQKTSPRSIIISGPNFSKLSLEEIMNVLKKDGKDVNVKDAQIIRI